MPAMCLRRPVSKTNSLNWSNLSNAVSGCSILWNRKSRMSFSAHSAFLCDRLLNMFCSAAYKLAPPFGHIKVELCPGLESNSWTKSAKPQCLCSIILFVLLYRNHRFCGLSLLLSYIYLLFSLCRVSICEIRNIIRKPTVFSLQTEALRYQPLSIDNWRKGKHNIITLSANASDADLHSRGEPLLVRVNGKNAACFAMYQKSHWFFDT